MRQVWKHMCFRRLLSFYLKKTLHLLHNPRLFLHLQDILAHFSSFAKLRLNSQQRYLPFEMFLWSLKCHVFWLLYFLNPFILHANDLLLYRYQTLLQIHVTYSCCQCSMQSIAFRVRYNNVYGICWIRGSLDFLFAYLHSD